MFKTESKYSECINGMSVKNPGALIIWMEFSVIFSGQMEWHFFHQVNETDWTVSFDRKFQMPVGCGLGGWLNFLSCQRFYRRTWKLIFLEKETTTSSVCLLQHPHFVRKISNQHPQCFPSMKLRSTLETRIMQVKRIKTQVPTTKLNSLSPAGLQLCS